MDPATAERRLDAYDRRTRRAGWIGALAVLAVFAGWVASTMLAERWLFASADDRAPFAGMDPSHGAPLSVLAQALATLWLLVCAVLARRLGGARAATLVWLSGAAFAPLAMAGVHAELRDWWVVEHLWPQCFSAPTVPRPSYYFWFARIVRFLWEVSTLDGPRALRDARFSMQRADALGFAGLGAVPAVWRLRHRLRLRVEGLVRPTMLAAWALLVATAVCSLTRPQPSRYLRGLPVAATLPAIGDPSQNPRAVPSFGLGAPDGEPDDTRHRVERTQPHFLIPGEAYGPHFFAVHDAWQDLVFRRECTRSDRCSLYWRRAHETRWSFQWPDWRDAPPRSFGPYDALTVRHDARRQIAYVTTPTFTVAAIRLDGRALPQDDLARWDLDAVAWRELSRDVAPPWRYTALALAGWLAVLLRRRPRAMRLVTDDRSVYRDVAAHHAPLEDRITRWNAARREADALGRVACLALTHAPLATVWLVGFFG